MPCSVISLNDGGRLNGSFLISRVYLYDNLETLKRQENIQIMYPSPRLKNSVKSKGYESCYFILVGRRYWALFGVDKLSRPMVRDGP